MKLMFHDDDCGEYLDSFGRCGRCRFYPDMQSTGFVDVPQPVVDQLLANGRTLLGLNRSPVLPPGEDG